MNIKAHTRTNDSCKHALHDYHFVESLHIYSYRTCQLLLNYLQLRIGRAEEIKVTQMQESF